MRRPLFLTTAFVVFLVFASTAAGNSPAPPTPGAVIAPLPGAVLEGPVTLVVDWPSTTRAFSVHLNGVDVTAELSRTSNGRRTLELTAGHGLRHGKNTIFVRRTLLGERQLNERFRFQVTETRPLASPGIAQRVSVGSRVDLTAIDSVRRPKTKTPLSYSWKVVPPASTGLEEHPLIGATERDASFVPTVPGTYRVTLGVHDGVASHPAATTVCAVPSRPWVPVSTMAEFADGSRGVELFGEPLVQYKAAAGGFAQLLTLNRKCLDLVGNVQVSSPQDLLARVQALSNDHRDDLLALIVVNPTNTGAGLLSGADLTAFNQAIQLLGGVPLTDIEGMNLAPGRFSLIGVPPSPSETAQPQGTADRRFQMWTDGPFTNQFAVEGQFFYLVPDQNGNYKSITKDRVSFDLNPPDTPAGQVAITLGGITISESIPADVEGGFMVVWADADDPLNYRSSLVVTNFANIDFTIFSMNEFRNELVGNFGIDFNELVFVRSFGTPVSELALIDENWLAAFNETVDTMAQEVGATPDVIFEGRADGYWLATHQGATPQEAVEAASIVSQNCDSQGQCTPTQTGLAGLLQRDPAGYFTARLKSSAPGTPGDATLSRLLVQPPTAWPLLDAAGTRAALAWVTGKITPTVGSDLRAAYWLKGIDFLWGGVQQQVEALTFDPSVTTFTAADLSAVQAQIKTELEYVTTAQTYVNDIATPFTTSAALEGWQTAQKLATAILNSRQPPADQADAIFSVAQILTDVVFVGSEFVDIEGINPVSAVADIMQLAVDVGSTVAGGGDDSNDLDLDLQTAVANLGTELTSSLEDTSESLTKGVYFGLVGDWAKLNQVGQFGGCIPTGENDPRCPLAWAWNDQIEAAAGNGLRLSIEQQTFASILPVVYGQAWFLPVDEPTHFNVGRHLANEWRCITPGIDPLTQHPFIHQPNSGSTELFHEIGPHGLLLYDIFALGDFGGQRPDPENVAVDIHVGNVTFDPTLTGTGPKVFITDRLFGEPDPGGDATQGGLGADPSWFFTDYLQTKTSAVNKRAPFQLAVCH